MPGPKSRYGWTLFVGFIVVLVAALMHGLVQGGTLHSGQGEPSLSLKFCKAALWLTSLVRVLDIGCGVLSGYVVSLFHAPPRMGVYRADGDLPGYLFHLFMEALLWAGLAYNMSLEVYRLSSI